MNKTLKSVMLCAAISGAIIAPMPALADNVFIMIVNTRGDDGIYRPALRVVRGGTVTYYSTQGGSLTTEILNDREALNAWLAQNAGVTAEEASAAIVESPPTAGRPEEEDDLEKLISDCEAEGGTVTFLPDGPTCEFSMP